MIAGAPLGTTDRSQQTCLSRQCVSLGGSLSMELGFIRIRCDRGAMEGRSIAFTLN